MFTSGVTLSGGADHLWVEVGAELLTALLQHDCINELVVMFQ